MPLATEEPAHIRSYAHLPFSVAVVCLSVFISIVFALYVGLNQPVSFLTSSFFHVQLILSLLLIIRLKFRDKLVKILTSGNIVSISTNESIRPAGALELLKYDIKQTQYVFFGLKTNLSRQKALLFFPSIEFDLEQYKSRGPKPGPVRGFLYAITNRLLRGTYDCDGLLNIALVYSNGDIVNLATGRLSDYEELKNELLPLSPKAYAWDEHNHLVALN